VCKLRIIEVFYFICLVACECGRTYELCLSRVLYMLQNCARFSMRRGRTGFTRSHFNAVKPTVMLQNLDFTYSY